jgi:hypothetical protein
MLPGAILKGFQNWPKADAPKVAKTSDIKNRYTKARERGRTPGAVLKGLDA